MSETTAAVDTAAVPVDETTTMQSGTTTTGAGVDPALVNQLVAQAREQGLQLSGEGGLLAQLAKVVLESALDGEITDHLGYDMTRPATAAVTAATVSTMPAAGKIAISGSYGPASAQASIGAWFAAYTVVLAAVLAGP